MKVSNQTIRVPGYPGIVAKSEFHLSSQTAHGFRTVPLSFVVMATDKEQMLEWVNGINACCGDQERAAAGGGTGAGSGAAAVWVPNSEALHCSNCSTPFTVSFETLILGTRSRYLVQLT